MSDYSKFTVLVVDDHMVILVKNLLVQIGFRHVDTAEDAAGAIARLESTKYDIILSDWNMPNMSGLELLKHVRASANPDLRTIPFILLTAEAKTDNIVAAKQAGVSNYIVKPLTVNLLKQKIDMTLGIT